MKKLVIFLLGFMMVCQLASQNAEEMYFRVKTLAREDVVAALALLDSFQDKYTDDRFFEIQRIVLFYDAADYIEVLRLCNSEKLSTNTTAARYAALASAQMGDYELWKVLFGKYLLLPQVYDLDKEKHTFEFVNTKAPAEWDAFWSEFKPDVGKATLIQANNMIVTYDCFNAYLLLQDFDTDAYRAERFLLSAEALMCIKDFLAARRLLGKAVKKYPSNFELNFNLALVLSELNRSSLAYEVFMRCIQIQPYNTFIWALAAVEANNSGKFVEAAQLYRKYLLCVGTDDFDVRFPYAQVLMNLGEYETALPVLDSLILGNPSVSSFRMARADAHYRLKNYELAFFDYQMSLDVNPVSAEAWFNAGWCAFHMNQTEKACTCWQKAMHYKHPGAEALIERYCKIK